MGTDSARSTLRPFVAPALAAILGLALTAALGLSEWGRHRLDLEAKFKQDAINRLNALQSVVQIHVALLDAVAGLYVASKVVEREEFNAFVREQRIERYGINALEWVPRVSAAEREGYEEAARRDGLTDFRIWESGADGRPVAASLREEYFPVYYVGPLAGNEAALGFDVGSDASRREALERARDTGTLAATERISLVQAGDDVSTVLLFQPIYGADTDRDALAQRRIGLAGYALGILRIGDLVEATFRGDPQADYDTYLFDDAAAPETRRLHFRPSDRAAKTSGPLPEAEIRRGDHWAGNLSVGGRQWSVVFRPASVGLAPWQDWHVLVIFAFGLLATGASAAFLARLASHARRLERLTADLTVKATRLLTESVERARVESELRGREQHLSAIMENAADGILTIFENGAVESINPAALRIFGYARDEVIGRNVNMLMPEPDRSRHDSYIGNYLRTGKGKILGVGPREVTALRRDGTTFPMDLAVSEMRLLGQRRFIGIVRDITSKVRAQQALRESEERFRKMADTMPALLWIADANHACSFVNRPWLDYIGGTMDQMLGDGWMAFVHPDDLEPILRVEHKGFEGWQPLTTEYRIRGADGEYRWFLDKSVPRFDVDGSFIGYIGTLLDVGDRRRLEAELRQTQKMEAIGQLTGGVAHDFNNLLTVIMGSLEMAEGQVGEDPRLRSALGFAMTAADRAADLIRQLMAFARQQPLQPRSLDLDRIVAGMTPMLRRTLGEHIEIEVKPSEGLHLALIDRTQLENALLNLAVNARDAMPQGGKLTIETANVHLDGDYAARNAEVTPGDYAMLAVSDSGVGMPPEVIERALEPFFTTKGPGKGTGLGLSMVYGFVKQSGGHMKIYSEVGHGTTMRLYLPSATAQPASPAEAPPLGAELPRGNETVLVVEDDAQVRKLVVSQLGGLGYRVLEASDGPAAEAVLEGGAAVDLLFTDIVMPGGMNGRQLADRARRRLPGLKVLFTSGYAENAIAHQGRLDPGVHLLSKPYKKLDLARKIRQVLEGPADAQ